MSDERKCALKDVQNKFLVFFRYLRRGDDTLHRLPWQCGKFIIIH